MKKGAGKRKGGAFERRVCKELSLWLSNGSREDLLWRSAMSGGRSTVGRSKGITLEAQAGDMSATHPDGYKFIASFLGECKDYKNLQFHGIITGTGYLIEFWNETITEANVYKKMPMLIARQSRLPIVVCLNRRATRALGLADCAAEILALKHDLYIFRFDYFLSQRNWEGLS